jgi:predicted phage terminase large subunit-like protein
VTALTATLDPFEFAARQFEPTRRRWGTPGAMAVDLDPGTRQSPALERIDAELVALADGDCDRLMVFMPPQEGKSQRCSRRFPSWLLAGDPSLRVAVVSYQEGKATRWGRAVRRDIGTHPELGLALRPDSRAAGQWETVQGGGMLCAGIGGAITGEPVDVLIVDDPFSGRAEAESVTYRDGAWDWWENVGSTRLSRHGRVLLMMTRWHEDDLAGRLMAREPGVWRVLSIPAVADGDDDPLGREPGEEMVSVTHSPGWFERVRSLRSAYVWRSVYQQRPTAAEGNLFRRGSFRYWHRGEAGLVSLDGQVAALVDLHRFVTVDLATSTKTSADWTVMSAWGITPSGDLLLLDRVRRRVDEGAHFAELSPLRQRWLRPGDVVHVESRMFGTTLVYAAGRAGVPIAELKADADKLTRALPAADLLRQGRVWWPADVPWLDEWCDELAAFPAGMHDDQVDTLAYAARVALAHWLPPEPPAREVGRAPLPDDGPASSAFLSATGEGTAPDLMAVQY